MAIWKMAALCIALAGAAVAQDADWPVYLGDAHSSHYSALTQIDRGNVTRLVPAWEYASEGGVGKGQMQCNPLILDGILYGVSPMMKVFALRADTGRELWAFTPEKPRAAVCRGLAWWQGGEKKRLFAALGSALYALDAIDGRPDGGFGNGGMVDLRENLGREGESAFAMATSPGVVYRDLIIMGTRVSEALPAAPGHIRAYDVRTGALRWTFHTIPQPGEFGYETWPEGAHERAGGANCWAGMSLDRERGMVYVPTGSAAFDFYGADRHGQNLFANCLLALDAATGERKWHYQLVHHDLWDRDLPAPPNLLTVTHDGTRIDAVAQITKSAHVFLFNRETGEPLFAIEERPAPQSTLEGEAAWPTQPAPVLPPQFSRGSFDQKDITRRTPEAQEYVRKRWDAIRRGKPFLPPSREGTLIFPGFDGGGEWGGAAVDPKGVLYVNASEMPWILTMVNIAQAGGDAKTQQGLMIYAQQCLFCHGPDREGNPYSMFPGLKDLAQRLPREQAEIITRDGKGFMPAFAHLGERNLSTVLDYIYGADTPANAPETPAAEAPPLPPDYRHTGYDRFVDQEGYPAITPPWGTLNAIDMNTGTILWKSVLGDTPELREKGMEQTGTENYGGPVVTAGGLVFAGATKDAMFHAFDKDTGALLWETKLPFAGYATPATYMVNGKQFIVIAAAGGKIGSPEGDRYAAFALKQE